MTTNAEQALWKFWQVTALSWTLFLGGGTWGAEILLGAAPLPPHGTAPGGRPKWLWRLPMWCGIAWSSVECMKILPVMPQWTMQERVWACRNTMFRTFSCLRGYRGSYSNDGRDDISLHYAANSFQPIHGTKLVSFISFLLTICGRDRKFRHCAKAGLMWRCLNTNFFTLVFVLSTVAFKCSYNRC